MRPTIRPPSVLALLATLMRPLGSFPLPPVTGGIIIIINFIAKSTTEVFNAR